MQYVKLSYVIKLFFNMCAYGPSLYICGNMFKFDVTLD